MNVIFPDGKYGLSERSTNKTMPEAMFFPVLRILLPERAQCNGELLQGQRGIPIFTDGSKLGGCTSAGNFCRELSLELHCALNDNCSIFLAKIFAILKAIEALASDSKS